MMKRKLLAVFQIVGICLGVIALSIGYDLFSGNNYLDVAYRPFRKQSNGGVTGTSPGKESKTSTSTPTPTPSNVESSTIPDGDPALLKNATSYVKAVIDPNDNTYPRLACPRPDVERYKYLKPSSLGKNRRKYFFALDIRQKVGLLPRLIGSTVEVLKFLGPENCVLSIVEGNSNDGTYEVLKTLGPEIEKLGTEFHFQRSAIDPSKGDRISKLAELRNLALSALVNDPSHYAADATLLFLNDVAICMEDILELLHQRVYLSADMVCAFDWTYVGADPTFYDVWIARTLAGDNFFDIPADGNWDSAWNLFWNNPDSRTRFFAHKPIQVFSCWNGAVAIKARPILDQLVRFRGPKQGECHQGEPQLFCKDLWSIGYGKIAAIPSINLEYDDDAGRKIKAAKGYTSQWIVNDGDEDFKIKWQSQPPEKVRCMPSYDKQTWEDWNQGLD